MEYSIDNAAADNSRHGTKNQDTQLSADGHDYQSPDSVFLIPVQPWPGLANL
jgi:hypothetical protein